MKLLIHFNHRLAVDFDCNDDDLPVIQVFSRQLVAAQEQIEAKIYDAAYQAILAALPDFKPQTMQMIFEDEC